MSVKSAVKERPILFKAQMVQAILEGVKTQTRRVMKDQPPVQLYPCGTWKWYWADDQKNLQAKYYKCPYGHVGDVLWVRETWKPRQFAGFPLKGYDYLADTLAWAQRENVTISKGIGLEQSSEGFIEKWRPSIFMPRAACRIKLEITDIRVERLHQITDDDAKAEGAPDHLTKDDLDRMKTIDFTFPRPFLQYQFGFMALWTKINGNKSWEANPWVWAITFKRL